MHLEVEKHKRDGLYVGFLFSCNGYCPVSGFFWLPVLVASPGFLLVIALCRNGCCHCFAVCVACIAWTVHLCAMLPGVSVSTFCGCDDSGNICAQPCLKHYNIDKYIHVCRGVYACAYVCVSVFTCKTGYTWKRIIGMYININDTDENNNEASKIVHINVKT